MVIRKVGRYFRFVIDQTQALLKSLDGQREHVLNILEGHFDEQLSTPKFRGGSS